MRADTARALQERNVECLKLEEQLASSQGLCGGLRAERTWALFGKGDTDDDDEEEEDNEEEEGACNDVENDEQDTEGSAYGAAAREQAGHVIDFSRRSQKVSYVHAGHAIHYSCR
jgi:hypothetical protein